MSGDYANITFVSKNILISFNYSYQNYNYSNYEKNMDKSTHSIRSNYAKKP